MIRHVSILFTCSLPLFPNVFWRRVLNLGPTPVHGFDLANLAYISTQKF